MLTFLAAAAFAHPATQLVVAGDEVWFGDTEHARLVRVGADGVQVPIETGLEPGCCHAVHLVGDEVWTGLETGGLVAVPRVGGAPRPIPLPDHPDARAIAVGGNPWCVAPDGVIWAVVGEDPEDRGATRLVRVADGEVTEIADLSGLARTLHYGALDCAEAVRIAAPTGVLRVDGGQVRFEVGGRAGDRDGKASRARFQLLTSVDADGDDLWLSDIRTCKVSLVRDGRVRAVYTAPADLQLVAVAARPGGAVALLERGGTLVVEAIAP